MSDLGEREGFRAREEEFNYDYAKKSRESEDGYTRLVGKIDKVSDNLRRDIEKIEELLESALEES